jgi:hypothetical protein
LDLSIREEEFMSAFSRGPEIRRRQMRKEKIVKLRRRYAQASEADRLRIFQKVKLLSPQITLEQFTKANEAKASA